MIRDQWSEIRDQGVNAVELSEFRLVIEYRISNKECRIMKFNNVFHYFDILRFLVRNSAVQKEIRLSQQH